MRSSREVLLAVLVVTTLATPSAFSRQRQSEQSPSDVTLGATEVTLDVTARDRRGRAITDLKPEDLTITEDGAAQQITSFRLVRPSAAAPGTPATTTPAATTPNGVAPPPPEEPRSLTTAPEDMKAIAIVFDALTPPARALAYENAKKYVEQNFQPGDAVGVFGIDLSLVAYQVYTTDRSAVIAGIQAAGEHAGASFASRRPTKSQLPGGGSVQSTDVEATGASTGGAASGSRQGDVDARLASMQTATAQGFERLQSIQAGFATTNSLLAVVEGLSLLPGRKAMLFFSEGIQIPDQVARQYEAVISSANQAHVTVYTVDAAGLRIASANALLGSALNDYGARRMAEIGTPSEGKSGPLLANLDGVETAFRSTTYASLGRLAKETGGYFVSDTNGIAARLRRVDDDLRTYYVVTYAPTNSNYDGSFRHVAVTARRSGVRVRTREGYYAINVENAPPVLPYEAPAVAAATAKTTRTDFAIRAIATSFPEEDRPGLSPVIVSVPASTATFMQDAQKKTFTTAFSVVVLARDETGRIAAKTSKQFILTGPLDALASTKSGDLLYYAELDLAPGRYTVDAAAYDAPSQRASVRHMPLVVAARADAGGPRLSSLTIVDRAEAVAAGENVGGEPFRVGDALLYPNLGTPLHKTADGKLAFFVTVYVGENVRQAPEARLEISKAGASLKTLPIELPLPDEHGRIQYTNAFAVDSLAPGTYELRVTVGDGAHSTARSARFTIAS